jgi:hypothetical protein
MTIRNSEKIACVGAQFCTRGLSLETTKKGGNMGGFFGNHGFGQGEQGPKGPTKKIHKTSISDWEILTRADWTLCFESYGRDCSLGNGFLRNKTNSISKFKPKHYIHTFKQIVQGRPPSYQKTR